MKLAFVTPRYGEEVVGGAEYGARSLAEQAVDRFGWPIEVFTSCARDAATWANFYPEGTTTLNGVTVHRFLTTRERTPGFDELSTRVLSFPRVASLEDQEQWIDEQGPEVPTLVEALSDSDADLYAFYPYLYYPTVRGIPRVAGRAVLHPAAHNEPPLFMPLFGKAFAGASGLVFHTEAERRLVEQVFPVAHQPTLVNGLASDAQPGDAPAARERHGIGERPYLLCLGRVDEGKGTALLSRLFIAYKERHPGPLALVLAGPVVHGPPEHPDIIVTGAVPEDEKWGLLRGAMTLVSPSPNESFSLVLIEAWNVGTPVLVNAHCPATLEHCYRSRAGLRFGSFFEFETALERLEESESLRAELAANGTAYVESNFRWPGIMDRYAAFLGRVADRTSVSSG